MHRVCCSEPFPCAQAQRELFLSGQRTPFAWAISKTDTDSAWQIFPIVHPKSMQKGRAQPDLGFCPKDGELTGLAETRVLCTLRG